MFRRLDPADRGGTVAVVVWGFEWGSRMVGSDDGDAIGDPGLGVGNCYYWHGVSVLRGTDRDPLSQVIRY